MGAFEYGSDKSSEEQDYNSSESINQFVILDNDEEENMDESDDIEDSQ